MIVQAILRVYRLTILSSIIMEQINVERMPKTKILKTTVLLLFLFVDTAYYDSPDHCHILCEKEFRRKYNLFADRKYHT